MKILAELIFFPQVDYDQFSHLLLKLARPAKAAITETLRPHETIPQVVLHNKKEIARRIYAQMKKQKSGHIVFITSVAADKPFKESAIYCMSKYAQKGLLDVMRIYGYEDQIKITEVKPGAVATPMWGDVPAEMKAKMMPPADIARSILDAILLPSSSSVEEITLRPLQGDFV